MVKSGFVTVEILLSKIKYNSISSGYRAIRSLYNMTGNFLQTYEHLI
jgi:hypothetical protein